jgi:hypothetical protein
MAPRYRKHPQTAGRVVDGLAFVVTGDDQKLHSLNATATHLWQLAVEGCTVDEAVDSLLENFEPPEPETEDAREVVTADDRECLDDLVARRILVVAS